MYPECTILYKTDNSDGWHYAIMSGSKKECTKECNKLKKQNNWCDFKCYVSSSCVFKRDIPFQNVVPNAYDLHLLTNLIYNPFNDKVYYPDENIPYPDAKKRTVNNFKINVIGEGEGEGDDYISEPDCVDEFECGTDVIVTFNGKGRLVTIAEGIISDIPKFVKRLKRTGYSYLCIEEYTFAKILAWETENKVRFIVQYYGDNDVETEVDKLISKDLFYKEFENFYTTLKNYVTKRNKLYNTFKKQENLLNSLTWKYDEDLPYVPWEYTLIKWKKEKEKELEKFYDMIYYSAEPKVIFKEELSECFTCKKIGDYYYLVSDKDGEKSIGRTYFYTYKLEYMYRFMHSKDFKYKNGMSLNDIYNQLLDKGYNFAIGCEYLGKDFNIYANGQVESKDATKNEIESLEHIVKDIAKTYKNKNKVKISDFFEKLRSDKIRPLYHTKGNMKFR